MKPIDFPDQLSIQVSEVPLLELSADCYIIETNGLMQPLTHQAQAFLKECSPPDLFLEEGSVLTLNVAAAKKEITLMAVRPSGCLERSYEQILYFIKHRRLRNVAMELLGARLDVEQRINALFVTILKNAMEGAFVVSLSCLDEETRQALIGAVKYYKCG